jgi:hypothetical protein
MDPLAVLDVVASVDIAEITEFDAEVVSSDCNQVAKDASALQDYTESSSRRSYPPLFIAIFPSSTSSEDKQMRTVSFLFLPLLCGKNPPLGQPR